jgi:hypothetical protein
MLELVAIVASFGTALQEPPTEGRLPERSIVQYGIYRDQMRVGTSLSLNEEFVLNQVKGRRTASTTFGRANNVGYRVEFESFHDSEGLPVVMRYRSGGNGGVTQHVATFFGNDVRISRSTGLGSRRPTHREQIVRLKDVRQLAGSADVPVYDVDPEAFTLDRKSFVQLDLLTGKLIQGEVRRVGKEVFRGPDWTVNTIRVDVRSRAGSTRMYLNEDGTVFRIYSADGTILLPETPEPAWIQSLTRSELG